MKYEKLISNIENGQEKNITEAYKVGYAGKRHPAFSAVGEDAEQQDIDRAIRVHIIDHYKNPSALLIDSMTVLLRPVLQEYIHGLKDGCIDKGNTHLWDAGRRFREEVSKQAENMK